MIENGRYASRAAELMKISKPLISQRISAESHFLDVGRRYSHTAVLRNISQSTTEIERVSSTIGAVISNYESTLADFSGQNICPPSEIEAARDMEVREIQPVS